MGEDNKMEKQVGNQKNNKNKNKISILIYIISFILSGIAGATIVATTRIENQETFLGVIFDMIIAVLIIIFSMFIQIIIHELGHLIFGLISGYKFNSFRIGSLVVIKQNNKIKLKYSKVTGLSGQCLLEPPKMDYEKVPFGLYNFGGVILNIITSIAFLITFLYIKDINYLSSIVIGGSIMGCLFAILNGVPLNNGNICNDGYNFIESRRSKFAKRSLIIQLNIANELSRDVRIKDMPEEWFIKPNEQEMQNVLSSTIAGYIANRLFDKHEFIKTKEYIYKLLEEDNKMLDIIKMQIKADLIYCELITGAEKEDIDKLFDKKQKEFMKMLKSNISIIRTMYAYELLYNNDKEKAEKQLVLFEKMSKNHPYKIEVVSEKELIEIVKEKKNNI